MSLVYYVAPDGTAEIVGVGASGNDGYSAYQVWLAEGNSGSQADFFASIAPEAAPSSGTVTATTATTVVPTKYSLLTLEVEVATEISFEDLVTAYWGTNPDGWTFTLHITSGANLVTFAPGVTVYGTIGVTTDIWCSVVREGGAWKVLVGAA